MAALLFGALLLLIPNALFALWAVWFDLNGDGTLTRAGRRYVSFMFGFVAVVLVTALMGLVGYVENL